MLRRLVGAALAALALSATASAAKADISFRVRGPVLYLSSHRLQPGDGMEFAAFLDQPRRVPIRIVYMNSNGGNTQVAIRIGQMIRERGLDTGFHVGHGRCVSACTTMFVGGVHRYYIGGRAVADGVATRRGLGFHPSGAPQAEERINDYYQRMGVPGAANLRYRIYSPDEAMGGIEGPRRLFFAGGNSAVRSGVATSTLPPRSLRD